tara:strand:+ start:216 stop:407 length:192 start_codon:yes stop_codon:yes gene_type:complete
VYIKVSYFNVNNGCFVAVLNKAIANVSYKLNVRYCLLCFIFNYLYSVKAINDVRGLTLKGPTG